MLGCASEKAEQATFATWLDINGYVFAYIPNDMPISSYRGGVNYGWLSSAIARGLQTGFPDYLIFGDRRGRALNLAVELKRLVGGKTSEKQIEQLARLSSVGWKTAVCAGAQSAIDFVKENS
jgi:hypothetical protein